MIFVIAVISRAGSSRISSPSLALPRLDGGRHPSYPRTLGASCVSADPNELRNLGFTEIDRARKMDLQERVHE